MDGYKRIIPAQVGANGPVIMIALAEDISPEHEVATGRMFSLEGFTKSVGAIASSMTEALRAVKPDEAEVEFGVDIGIQAGELTSLIVKGSGTATVRVKLIWRETAATTGT